MSNQVPSKGGKSWNGFFDWYPPAVIWSYMLTICLTLHLAFYMTNLACYTLSGSYSGVSSKVVCLSLSLSRKKYIYNSQFIRHFIWRLGKGRGRRGGRGEGQDGARGKKTRLMVVWPSPNISPNMGIEYFDHGTYGCSWMELGGMEVEGARVGIHVLCVCVCVWIFIYIYMCMGLLIYSVYVSIYSFHVSSCLFIHVCIYSALYIYIYI